MQQDNPAAQAITGQFTLSAQLPQGKTFQVVGYIYDGESMQSLNQRVDLLHDAVDRQRTRAEIPEIEAKVNQVVEQLEGNKVHYAVILSKRDKGGKLSTQEKQQIEVMDVNNDMFAKEIQKGRERLAEMRKSLEL